MAVNAVERHSALHTNWLRLLAPSPERLEFTTRLALICALTTLVTEIYQTPDAALTVYLAFFFNRPERTESLILSVVLPLVIGVVIALIFLVANLVMDDAMWRVISIAVISFALLFLGSASKLRPIASTVALIVGYALALLGTVQTGELATRALLYIYLDVAIAAGVSLLVNLLLAPAPRRTAEKDIAERLKLCALVLRDAGSRARSELAAKVREGMATILKQLKFAAIEKSALPSELGALRQGALSCFALMSAADALAANPEIEVPARMRAKLAENVEQLACVVERGGRPLENAPGPPDEASLSPLAHDLVAAIRDCLRDFAEPEGTAQKSARKAQPGVKKGGGFLAEDAFTNPEHVQYALKTTAAAVSCYLLYSLLNWPGIHTCFLTCYIVAQSTAAESVEKLSLRITGCLIGAAVGLAAIVFLVPSLTSIGGLMIAVFVGAWVGAYVAAGTPRISYAGFQFAFAFFLCVIQGSGPALNLTTARDRIIGILIGNVVAYCALVYVWPVTITRRVDPALAVALGQLAQAASAAEPRERRLLGSQAQGALGDIQTDIELAHYEPASVRSPAAWLSARRQLVENSQSLGTLLVSGDARELSRVDAATRLERLATRLAGTSHAGPLTSWAMESAHGWQTLPARVDRRLRALEETLAPGVGDSETNAHAHA